MFKFGRGALRTILFHKPLNARLWLTYRCNYSCRTCGIRYLKPYREMDLSELAVAAKNLAKIGLSQVIFTGGEPLLRGDIVEIIRIFSKYNFILRLQTNGGPHVTEELLRRCYDAGLNDISISLDTLDPVKMDDICDARDVLNNALRVIVFCVKNFSNYGVVSANVTVTAQNFYELPELAEYVHGLGAFFDPCVFSRVFSSYDGNGKKEDYVIFDLRQLDPDKVKKIFARLDDLFRKNYRIITTGRTMQDLKRYIMTGDYSWECLAGTISLDILPSGELAPCCDTTDIALNPPVANVKENDFVRIFRSHEFKEKCRLRRQKCPGCLYGCYRDPKYLTYDPRVICEAFYKSLRFNKFLK